jgi:protein SCO1/2
MIRKHLFTLFIIIIVLVPVTIYGVVKWSEDKYGDLPILPSKDHVIQPFSVFDQDGKEMTVDKWQGKIVVVNFFFTHCPVVCPKMIKQMQRVQAFTRNDNTLLLSFSVDPERDSIGRLKEYSSQVNIKENWKLLTGDKREIYALARKGFNIVATDGDGGPNDFIHSEQLVLIDQSGKIRGYYKGTEPGEVDQLIKDIRKLSDKS